VPAGDPPVAGFDTENAQHHEAGTPVSLSTFASDSACRREKAFPEEILPESMNIAR